MFHRLIVEDWTQLLPLVSFCIFAGVFTMVTIRALRMSAVERQHLATLPLDKQPDPSTSHE